MYFSVLSPKQVFWKFFCKLLYDKMVIIVRSIMKSCRHDLNILHFKLHMLCATLLYFPVKWQWSLTLRYFLSFKYLFSIIFFFYKYNIALHFHMIPAAYFLITSFFLFNINSQNFFIQFLPLLHHAYFLWF